MNAGSLRHRYLAALTGSRPRPAAPVTVTRGGIIRIVPDKGPERLMRIAHVEQHIITLSDPA